MDIIEFTSIMERDGCIGNDKDFCGVYGDIPYSVAFVQGRKGGSVAFYLRIQFADKLPSRMFSYLRQQTKAYVRLQRLNTSKGLFCVLVTTKKIWPFETAYDHLFDEIEAVIDMLGMKIADVCPICRQGDCDSFAFINPVYQKAHAACVHNHNADIQAQVQQNEMTGSYGLGAVGAILGGLVGMIPSVALAVFFDLISGWLCALIPLGAYYGYKLLRGKMSNGALKIIIAVSIIAAPITLYLIELGWSILEGWGGFTLLDYLEYMLIFPEDVLPALLQVLAFIGIGFYLVYKNVSKNNANVWKEASISEAMLRPMADLSEEA